MDQLEAIETPPLVVTAGDITLIEGAARDLHDLGEEQTIHGHRPSWAYSQIPDGLALGVGCWRPLAAHQLGGARCPGQRRPLA